MSEETETESKIGHNSKPIDFAGAAALMKGKATTLRDRSAKIRGDQSAVWGQIEEKGVNKKAAKAIFALQDKGSAEVSDYLRTFIGLLEPLGLGILRDMVDAAEGQYSIAVPLIETPSVDV